jgi:hypothetical protein
VAKYILKSLRVISLLFTAGLQAVDVSVQTAYMNAYGGMEVQSHIFLTSALVGGDGQLHAQAALTSGKQAPISTQEEAE